MQLADFISSIRAGAEVNQTILGAVGHCADNSAAERFWGMIKREDIHRHLTLAEARSDVFGYVERFHNPGVQRKIEVRDRAFIAVTQLSARTK